MPDNTNYLSKYEKYNQKCKNIINMMGGVHINTYTSDVIESYKNISQNTRLIKRIDDMYFMLIAKNVRSGRDIILLKSSKVNDFDDPKNFNFIVFYGSISELNFFRLAAKCKTNCYTSTGVFRAGTYYKGIYHYVQQTFVDLRLQKFINKKFYKIPLAQIEGADVLCDSLLISHIDDISRRITNDCFPEDERNYCGYAVDAKYKEVLENMKTISENIKKNYAHGEKELVYHYKKNDAENEYEYFVYKVDLIPRDEEKQKDPRETLVLFFMIVDFCKFSGNKFVILSEGHRTGIFQNLEEGYRCEYSDFYIPVFLTNKTSKITEYGTCETYVMALNYICKFLDYSQQCTHHESGSYKCSDTYSIIALRYVNVYPFNELANTPLIDAIVNEDIGRIINSSDLLTHINIPNQNTGMTPLFYAVERADETTIDFLILNGANLKYVNQYTGESVLMHSIKSKNSLEIIKKLIENGADVDYINQLTGKSVLIFSIENKVDPEIIIEIIQRCTDINFPDKETQYAPIFYEYMYGQGNNSIINSFILRGFSINSFNKDFMTLLHCSIKNHDKEMSDYLISLGADINVINQKTGMTSLLYAMQPINEKIFLKSTVSSAEEMVKFAILKGANVRYINDFTGESALIYCIKNTKNLVIVNELISSGADINVLDKEEKSAIVHAICRKNEDIVKILIEMRAELPSKGNSLLEYALSAKNHNIIKMIFDYEKPIKLKINNLKMHIDPYSSRSGISAFKVFRFLTRYELPDEIVEQLFQSLSDNCKIKKNYTEFINWYNDNKLSVLTRITINCNVESISTFPVGIKSVIFGKEFKGIIRNIPEGVTTLKFGPDFNGELNDLPSSLEYLFVSEKYTKEIQYMPNLNIKRYKLDSTESESFSEDDDSDNGYY